MFGRVLIGFVAVVLATPVSAEKRVALVVGNAAYKNVSVLENPANDARLMAETLSALGFSLVGSKAHTDLDKAGFDRAVQEFGAQLLGANVGLFYYAGHGIQVRGSNYLVPVGANPAREADIDFQMLDTNVVLRQMESAGTRLNLVILDACRNNPFGGRGLRSSNAGLAQIQAPEGTLISFATQPGSVALDGNDGNSPYTKALARTIRRGGLDIFQTFNEVGLAVKQATAGSQQPWVSSSPISGSFYFAGLPDSKSSSPSPDVSEAERAWNAVSGSSSVAVIEAFIERYGNSIYASFARARRDELKKSQAAAVQPPSAPPTATRTAATRAEVTQAFAPFAAALETIRKNYVETPDEPKFLTAAIAAMRSGSPEAGKLAAAGPAPPRPAGAGASRIDNVYDAALDILNQDKARDKTALVEAAMTGALASLDPHSSYLSASAFRDMQVQSRGEFGGLGIEVTMEGEELKVVTPLEGAPAAKAGMRGGDIITRVDGKSLQGVSLSDAVGRMRGPVGSIARLEVRRPAPATPLVFAITRETIRVQAVRSRIEGGDVGYLRISQFNERTLDSVKQAIAELAPANKLKGYIIDLRNNPGGLLDQAAGVADAVMERGEIVSARGRTASEVQRLNAKAGDLIKGKRLVVLINGGTASGAEILAGALQDHKRATVVGSRSFGKGTLQTIVPLGDGNGALRLTTARYYTPSGRSIQANGIAPDIEILESVPDDLKDAGRTGGESSLPGHIAGGNREQKLLQSYVPPDSKNDRALARAMQALRSK